MIEFILAPLLAGIFYWPGWLLLKILTIGRYPPATGVDHNIGFVITFGMAAFIVVLGIIYS